MKNQSILIAGGTGDIGRACAEQFLKAGAKVSITGRDQNKLDQLASELGQNGRKVSVIKADVTDSKSVADMVETVIENYGRIDVLVNAFGTGMIQPLHDIDPEQAANVLNVNILGTFLVTQEVTRHMVSAKKGSVIMFPGILGKTVMKNTSIYSASKYAVTGFTKALVEEHKRSGIRYSLFYLGGVNTSFWDNPNVNMRVQKDKMLSVDEVAKAVFYAALQQGDSVLSELVLQPESHQMV